VSVQAFAREALPKAPTGEVRRTSLPRTRVHKGKREDRGAWCGAEETLPPPRRARRRRRWGAMRDTPASAPASALASADAWTSYPPAPSVSSPKWTRLSRLRCFVEAFARRRTREEGAGTGEGAGPRWKPRSFAARVVLLWLPVLRAPLLRQAFRGPFRGPNAVGRGLASPNPRQPLGPYRTLTFSHPPPISLRSSTTQMSKPGPP
jgi:hypothetical protein